MAIKVQNTTNQVIPIVCPTKDGGDQINIFPRKTVVLALDKATSQINHLVGKGILKIKK